MAHNNGLPIPKTQFAEDSRPETVDQPSYAEEQGGSSSRLEAGGICHSRGLDRRSAPASRLELAIHQHNSVSERSPERTIEGKDKPWAEERHLFLCLSRDALKEAMWESHLEHRRLG